MPRTRESKSRLESRGLVVWIGRGGEGGISELVAFRVSFYLHLEKNKKNDNTQIGVYVESLAAEIDVRSTIDEPKNYKILCPPLTPPISSPTCTHTLPFLLRCTSSPKTAHY